MFIDFDGEENDAEFETQIFFSRLAGWIKGLCRFYFAARNVV